jgi:WD40 repeat protein
MHLQPTLTFYGQYFITHCFSSRDIITFSLLGQNSSLVRNVQLPPSPLHNHPNTSTMNLSLTDPFVLAQDYPESTTGSLRSGHATCVRFNRKGDFLAAGRVDGTVVIFDVETNGVARKLKGHTRQVQSLSWSRDGRYLLTSSQDWKCNIWDLSTGGIVRSVRFEAPVYIAELHPWNQ